MYSTQNAFAALLRHPAKGVSALLKGRSEDEFVLALQRATRDASISAGELSLQSLRYATDVLGVSTTDASELAHVLRAYLDPPFAEMTALYVLGFGQGETADEHDALWQSAPMTARVEAFNRVAWSVLAYGVQHELYAVQATYRAAIDQRLRIARERGTVIDWTPLLVYPNAARAGYGSPRLAQAWCTEFLRYRAELRAALLTEALRTEGEDADDALQRMLDTDGVQPALGAMHGEYLGELYTVAFLLPNSPFYSQRARYEAEYGAPVAQQTALLQTHLGWTPTGRPLDLPTALRQWVRVTYGNR